MNTLILIPILVLCSILANVMRDKYRVDRLNKQINHAKSLAFWMVITFGLSYLCFPTWETVIATMALYFGTRLWAFDPLLNIARDKPMGYLGDPKSPHTALTDKILSKIKANNYIRMIIGVLSVAAYFFVIQGYFEDLGLVKKFANWIFGVMGIVVLIGTLHHFGLIEKIKKL